MLPTSRADADSKMLESCEQFTTLMETNDQSPVIFFDRVSKILAVIYAFAIDVPASYNDFDESTEILSYKNESQEKIAWSVINKLTSSDALRLERLGNEEMTLNLRQTLFSNLTEIYSELSPAVVAAKSKNIRNCDIVSYVVYPLFNLHWGLHALEVLSIVHQMRSHDGRLKAE